MSQAPIDPLALTKLAMSQGEIQHRRTMEMLDRDFAERQFAYKKQMNDRARNDRLYDRFQGQINADFVKRFSESMGEMTFGAMNADVRAQRAKNTPPLFVFDNTDMIPNPQADQILAGAGPGSVNTPPGMVPQSATQRAAPPPADPKSAAPADKGEPVAKSVTPEKPKPGEATTTPAQTPQQVNVQRVRSAGSSMAGPGQGGGPNMMGMRSTINAVHVDPVTGQMFGNVRGHMVPMDDRAWGMLQDWQRNQINAYSAQTRRMNASSYRSSVNAQDELLRSLVGNSNHGKVREIVGAFPGMPATVVDSLQRAGSTFVNDPKQFDRHAGEIVSALQSGDMEALQSALYELESDIYDEKTQPIRDQIKDIDRNIAATRDAKERQILREQRRGAVKELHRYPPPNKDYKFSLGDINDFTEPSNPTEANTGIAVDVVASNNNMHMMKLLEGIRQEWSNDKNTQEEMPLTFELLDALTQAALESGVNVEDTSVSEMLTIIGRAAGLDQTNGNISVTVNTPSYPAETSGPTDLVPVDSERLKREYLDTLMPNQIPNKEGWESFLMSRGIDPNRF